MSNPTTLVSMFSGSAPGWSLSGPERYDGGLWLEEGTVNLFPNPSVEVNLDSLSFSWGTASGERSSDWAYDGSYAAKITSSDGGWFTSDDILASPATDYMLSAYAKGSGNIRLGWRAKNFTLGLLDDYVFGGPVALTGTPQRIALPFATDNPDTQALLLVAYNITGGGVVWYTDAMQLEAKSYATSYTASTRAASSASLPTAGHIAPGAGALAFYDERKIDTGAEEIIVTCGTVGSGTDAMRIGYDATDHPFMEWNSDNAGWERVTSSDTVAAGVRAFLYFDWTGTTIRCSVDDGAKTSGSRAAVQNAWGAGALSLVA